MYPYDIIPGFDLYALFYLLALISALLLLRAMCDKIGIEVKIYNLALGSAVAAIIVGYLSSVLTQSCYDWLKTGTFRFGSGMTFYGGFIGGTVTFLIVYAAVGKKICRDGLHMRRLPVIADIAACSVSAAHATGRIGCAFAGCCHGARTDSWYGIWNEGLGYKTVPVQLMESVFLFIICVLFCRMVIARKPHVMPLYLVVYGVWRFAIEFLRTDDRGASLFGMLSPSQATAIILVAAGSVLFSVTKKRCAAHDANENSEV